MSNCHEIVWICAQMTESFFVDEQNLVWSHKHTFLWFSECPIFYLFDLPVAFSVACLFIGQLDILHLNHLKLSTHYRVDFFDKKKLVWPQKIQLREFARVHLILFHSLVCGWIFETLQICMRSHELCTFWLWIDINLGVVFHFSQQKGDIVLALEDYKKAADLHPSRTEAMFNIGQHNFNLK